MVFGGYGIAPRSIQPESEFIPSGRMVLTGHLGWTNEFHFYDLETGKLNSERSKVPTRVLVALAWFPKFLNLALGH